MILPTALQATDSTNNRDNTKDHAKKQRGLFVTGV